MRIKAQSTLEYVIVLSAIVGVILWAAATKIKPAVDEGFKDVASSIDASATNFGK